LRLIRAPNMKYPTVETLIGDDQMACSSTGSAGPLFSNDHAGISLLAIASVVGGVTPRSNNWRHLCSHVEFSDRAWS
jgi:hypothetical protein